MLYSVMLTEPFLIALRTSAMRIAILLVIGSSGVACRAQVATIDQDTFTQGLLQQDFDVLRSALEEAHPGLHVFKSKSAMDSLFKASRASIPAMMTDREFMVMLCKLVARIGDGHLRVVPPKKRLDPLDEGEYFLPLQVFWDNGELYVSKNYSTLPDTGFVGARISSINGHPAAELLKELLEMIPSDGSNLTHKYRILSSSRLIARYLYMLDGYSSTYHVEIIPRNAISTRTLDLAAITYETLLQLFTERYPVLDAQRAIEFKRLESGGVGYLRIVSFDKGLCKKQKIDFEKYLKHTFTELAKDSVRDLIIDLRDNGGGTDEYGRIPYSYFTNVNFHYYRTLRMMKESFAFFKYTTRPDMVAPKGMLKANAEGSFDNVQHPNIGIQKPSRPTYTGRVYVLMDGKCFSTTSEFLSMLHNHTKAVFIGEESGGGYYGNCSGPTPDRILPNTMVRLEIPLMQYRMNVDGYPYADRGVLPNEPVVSTIQDKLNGRDAELERALELIKVVAKDKH